jgi:hypothetical protein
MILQMTEVNAKLLDQGVLGLVVIILLSTVVYLQVRIVKKDEKILELTEKYVESFNVISNLIASLSAVAIAVPERVREKIVEDLRKIEDAIQTIKLNKQ